MVIFSMPFDYLLIIQTQIMNKSIGLILLTGFLISNGCTNKPGLKEAEKPSQHIESGIFDRIDTVTVFDPETQIEVVKIAKYSNIILNLKDCNSPIKRLTSETQKVPYMKIRDLSGFEPRCMGKYSDNWMVKSFNISIMKNDKKTDSISKLELINDSIVIPPNVTSSLEALMSKAMGQFLSKSNAGDVVLFENIILVNSQKDSLIASVDFLLE